MKRVFLDTNIVVYNHTRTEPVKYEKSAELLLRVEGVISTQVLSEMSNVLCKKFKFGWADIQKVIREVDSLLDILIVTPAIIDEAITIADRYHYGYYDSLILTSAIEASCEVLYSEDFQHNQIIEGVRIINPFL
jgi:predicted nucleic acid-binding protein